MNSLEIKYVVKTATENEILNNLKLCDKFFIPPLSTHINLEIYSHKLFEHSVTFEAWHEHKLVGLLAAYFNDPQKLTGYITNVSIEKQYEGKHIASDLIKKCINYATDHQFKKILLEVNKNNYAAINLYHKFGFKAKYFNNENIIMILEIY